MTMESPNFRSNPPDIQRQMLLEMRVSNEKKSVGLAYVLWFFLGLLGVHNFYLGSTGLGSFQLFGGLGSVILFFSGSPLIGVLLFCAWLVSFILDLFLIPARARRHSNSLRADFGKQ